MSKREINNIFQAKYEASRLGGFKGFDNIERLIGAYMKTGIQVYPHQIVAALAAMEDPLRKGFILADEVGLGKSIEAMLVVSQYHHEGKKICIVVPSPLLAIWKEMVGKKFGLPLDGEPNEEDETPVTVITYTEAVERADDFAGKFDYVVFEEAHRLRKFHTGENKTAIKLNEAFATARKLLLTATPMPKHVMDLYGLISFIDDSVLGDADEFYQRYYKREENYEELKDLISPFIFRTLRSQVKADVNLPERNILTYSYKLEAKAEIDLNNKLLRYLGKAKKQAFPEMGNWELSLMLNKILSSSIYALQKTLAGILTRLSKMPSGEAKDEAKEIEELLNLATSIKATSKGKTFLKALDTAMRGLREGDHNKKAIIFTENTETQKYIVDLLKAKTNYKVAAYNGSTSEKPLDDFRAKANILVATDSAAEGFNFEFCNLVINYDNLWLASSIEQRIGRIHRIGQKSDVVVLNFLCTELLADVRWYELAFKRLNMLGGILGATDDVVSNISTGEIEKRIKETLEQTRNATQTEKDYKELTADIEEEIEENKTTANNELFRTFDSEIAKKTKNYAQLIKEKAAEIKDRLWALAKFGLKNYARFNEEQRSFNLTRSVFKSGKMRFSTYEIDFDKDTEQSMKFTPNNAIANQMMSFISLRASGASGELILTSADPKLKGKSGTLAMFDLSISNLTKYATASRRLFVGYDREGKEISEDTLRQIMELECINHIANERTPRDPEDMPSREDHEETMKRIRGESNPQIAALKAKHVPIKEEEIKQSFGGIIASGLKRIKIETERSKFGLKIEADKLEKELARLKREKESGQGDQFGASQRIAELSGQLNKLRETEFMTKLKLKKDEEEKTKAFMEQFKFYTYTSFQFEITFSIQ